MVSAMIERSLIPSQGIEQYSGQSHLVKFEAQASRAHCFIWDYRHKSYSWSPTVMLLCGCSWSNYSLKYTLIVSTFFSKMTGLWTIEKKKVDNLIVIAVVELSSVSDFVFSHQIWDLFYDIFLLLQSVSKEPLSFGVLFIKQNNK